MSTLENLTAKIRKDHENQAKTIIAEAESKANSIVEEAIAAAREERKRILADAEIQAAREEEQLVLGRTLAVRDENLNAKQEVLDRVFAEALNRLNAMEKDAFFQYLGDYLSALDLDGEEILLPDQYSVTSIDELNSYLKEKGGKGNLVLAKDPSRSIRGGFILRKGGIEQNNTFESLIDYYRYELESEVTKKLY